ncbi:TetR/AcrR family transcriptional regulator [Erysipelothrix larvae]|nr:TetR/AcrR family transcriptional regulator [Erysipelothrix larvae]
MRYYIRGDKKMVCSNSEKIRREAILERAQALFLEHGYDETSIAHIAKTLNIAKGLIYYYFDTKEDILNAVIERKCELQLSMLIDKMDSVDANFNESLVLLIAEYSSFKQKTISTYRKVLQHESRLFAEYHRQYLVKLHDVIEKVVAMGIQEAKLVVKYPLEMVIMVLEGAYRLEFFEKIPLEEKLGLIETALHLNQGELMQAVLRLRHEKVINGGDAVE